jgi:hypothetical protein
MIDDVIVYKRKGENVKPHNHIEYSIAQKIAGVVKDGT